MPATKTFQLGANAARYKGVAPANPPYDVERRVAKHLRPFFRTKKPFEIRLTLLDEYGASRTGKAAPATVNKELAYLRRAFRLGYRHEPQLVEAVPMIRRLPISTKQNFSARQPHVGAAQFAVRRTFRDQHPFESDTVLDKNDKSQ